MRRKGKSWSRRFLALCTVAGALVIVPSTAEAGTPLIRPHRFAPAAVPMGAKEMGSLRGGQRLSLTFVLPPSDGAGLKSLLANLYNPASAQYHQWLPAGQFDAEFAPAPADVASVVSWLRSRGFRSVTHSGFAVRVSAPARVVSTALGISLRHYRSASGSVGYRAQETPLIPEDLADGSIQSILGLNSLDIERPEELSSHAATTGTDGTDGTDGTAPAPDADGLTACAGATDESDGGRFWTMDQLGAAYGLDSLLAQGQNGHGETVGLFELASHSPFDVSNYESCFGLGNPVSTVSVDGGGGPIDADGGTVEADLDIEQVATQSPQSSIVSYEGPDTETGTFDVWSSIVSSDVAESISTSWGQCEAYEFSGGGEDSFTALFEQAAAQGQSIFAASGDSGSEGCYSPQTDVTSLAVDYPSSDAFVTAVGGTTLPAPLGMKRNEGVWNDCGSDETLECAEFGESEDGGPTGAGGGGVSSDEPRPSDQPDVQQVNGSCANECREVPDVSANAGTPMVIYADGWFSATGTSFAAPFWAGLVADRDDGCTGRTGLFSSALYTLYDDGDYGSAFNDVTTSNNDLTGSNSGQYAAGTGYDLASGIGTPIAAGLSCPEVTSVAQGKAGRDVVVSGLGLENASIDFGSSQASVVSASDTQDTVVVPPGSGTVTVIATSGGIGAGVSTAPFTYAGITTTSLPTGLVGASYSQPLAAVGVSAPESWTVSSGALPGGLSLNPGSGVISGTPTAEGDPTFTVQLSAAQGVVVTDTLSIGIFGSSSTTTATATPATTQLGDSVTFSASVTSAGGTPTGTVSFAVGSNALCSVALSSGTASCSSSAAPAGIDTVTASYSDGSGVFTFMPSAGTASLIVTDGPYTPLHPTRACDTRPGNPSDLNTSPADQCNGIFDSGSTIPSGGTKPIIVAGGFGVPADATAAVLNVTVVNPAAGGYLTVYPTGSAQPATSNINFVAGEVVPNLIEVGIGTGGDVSFLASAKTDMVVDIEGYTAETTPAGTGAGLYTALASPALICDTRSGNPSNLVGGDAQCNGTANGGERLGAGKSITVSVTGLNGVLAGASAAVLNLTVVGPSAAGYLTAYPSGTAQPVASNVNYTVNQTTTNRVIVPLSSSGQITVYSSVSANVIVDVSGYFSAPSGTGAEFNSEVTPVRICDTRAASPVNQCTGRTIGPADTLKVTVVGLAGVPASATSVAINLTGIAPTAATYLTVFPGPTLPFVSDLNPAAGEVRANLVVATLNSNGTISIYNDTGSVNVVVDVLGWYSSIAPQ